MLVYNLRRTSLEIKSFRDVINEVKVQVDDHISFFYSQHHSVPWSGLLAGSDQSDHQHDSGILIQLRDLIN